MIRTPKLVHRLGAVTLFGCRAHRIQHVIILLIEGLASTCIVQSAGPETREESAVGLNRHQRGVARGDAAPVIESLGAAERLARTAGALVPEVPRHGRALRPGRPHVKRIGHHTVPLLIFSLRIVHFFEHLVAPHDGSAQLLRVGVRIETGRHVRFP